MFGVHQDGSEPVHVVKFSPDGSLLAIGSRDNAIYMYQVRTNRFSLGVSGTVRFIYVSDGQVKDVMARLRM